MREAYRVVEDQASLSSYRATQDEEKAIQLELLIEHTKPSRQYAEWPDLVATPFRYPLSVAPNYQARFRPLFSNKNIFYASGILQTTLYEYSFHFMRQRLHLFREKKRRKVKKNETGTRTAFSVNTDDTNALDIRKYPNIDKIMSKADYSASHVFIREHSDIGYIIYPSARDPKGRNNMAILNIDKISKTLNHERSLNYFYDYGKREILWVQEELKITWQQVS